MSGKMVFSVGTRTVAGTDFPIENTVERDGTSGRPWLVTFSLCNGIPVATKRYATKREAIDAADINNTGLCRKCDARKGAK